MNTHIRTFRHEAALIRKIGAGAHFEETLRKAVKLLAEHAIPHWVAGGFAVQEWGYPRTTKDLGIIVPHARKARDLLLTGGFEQSPEARMTVVDIATEVEIDILSGGKRPTGMEILPLPMPREVSAEPRILPLEMLITHKLSAGRAQDFADVVALTKANALPRDYPVDLAVRTDYEEAWDTAAAEEAVRGMMQEDDEEP